MRSTFHILAGGALSFYKEAVGWIGRISRFSVQAKFLLGWLLLYQKHSDALKRERV